MGFKLKQEHEAFQVVEGPFAGHTYQHGVPYDKVPPQEEHKFDSTEVEESKGQKVAEGKKKNSSTLRLLDPATDDFKGGEQS